MDFPIHIDTINIGLSIMYIKGLDLKGRIFEIMMYFYPSKVVIVLANSSDPDEMQHYAAFHLGLHCLPKYPFRGFQNTKG